MKKIIMGIVIFISLCTKIAAETVEVVTVDIIKQGKYIFICDAESRSIIFELYKDKKVDQPDYNVFDELLLEASGKEADGKPVTTYKKYSNSPEVKK